MLPPPPPPPPTPIFIETILKLPLLHTYINNNTPRGGGVPHPRPKNAHTHTHIPKCHAAMSQPNPSAPPAKRAKVTHEPPLPEVNELAASLQAEAENSPSTIILNEAGGGESRGTIERAFLLLAKVVADSPAERHLYDAVARILGDRKDRYYHALSHAFDAIEEEVEKIRASKGQGEPTTVVLHQHWYTTWVGFDSYAVKPTTLMTRVKHLECVLKRIRNTDPRYREIELQRQLAAARARSEAEEAELHARQRDFRSIMAVATPDQVQDEQAAQRKLQARLCAGTKRLRELAAAWDSLKGKPTVDPPTEADIEKELANIKDRILRHRLAGLDTTAELKQLKARRDGLSRRRKSSGPS